MPRSEKPVLGKISLIRRAKSAVARTAATKQTNDKHPLFHVAWHDLEQRAASAAAVNNAFEATPAKKVVDHQEMMVDQDDAPPTTVDEVRRHMEQFHMRKSQQPGLSRQVMDPQTGKFRRAKTARNKYVFNIQYNYDANLPIRVSPTEDDRTRGSIRSRHIRCDSAITLEKQPSTGEEAMPYPLEPWSTKDLANINQLLGGSS